MDKKKNHSFKSYLFHLNVKHVAASTSTGANSNVGASNTTKQRRQLKYRYAIKI